MAGRFIVLDGIDGCGKSTQARRLAESLSGEGRSVLHLREPGSTGAGERIRELLLSSDVELGPAPEALLFAAARRQMLDERVRPALARDQDVVCERFHASTYAYQAVAGELDEEELLALLDVWAGDPRPDLLLILEIDPAVAWSRTSGLRDRIESRGLPYLERVAEGYRRYAERALEPVARIDAAGSAGAVFERVSAEVRRARP